MNVKELFLDGYKPAITDVSSPGNYPNCPVFFPEDQKKEIICAQIGFSFKTKEK